MNTCSQLPAIHGAANAGHGSTRLERIDAQGEVVTPLEAAAMEQVAERGAAAIAVCLLFSYLNPGHELKLGRPPWCWSARAGDHPRHGGTSCEVGLLLEGAPKFTTEFEIE